MPDIERSTGRPPAVFAACDLREEFSESVLGACHVAPKPKESSGEDRIQMCICMDDLCNRGATIWRSQYASYWISFVAIVVLLVK